MHAFECKPAAALVAVCLALDTGCAGTDTGSPATASTQIQVAISPSTATVPPSQGIDFIVSISGTSNTAATWSVEEGTSGGGVTQSGHYTAPPAAGLFHVVVRSAADPGRSARAAVTVSATPVVRVSVVPQIARVDVGGSQQFTASVTGTPDDSVRWSVVEGAGGNVSGAGLYSAPHTAGVYHVRATSTVDPSASGDAEVRVTVPQQHATVAISPATTSVSANGNVQFSATVTGVNDPSVTFQVVEAAGGAITAGGWYTAPASPGDYHVKAVSVADLSASATATVSVSASPSVTVSILPPSASVSTGGTQAFSATVTGAADLSVAWSVQEADGGSVDVSGLYRAPQRGGVFHVVATSHADPSKSAAATVTVAGKVTVTIKPVAGPHYEAIWKTGDAKYSIGPGTAIQFGATVDGAADPSVTWSIDEGGAGGTIDGGLYTFPADDPYVRIYDQSPKARIFHVRATSNADHSASASVTIDENLVNNGGGALADPQIYLIWWGDAGEFPPDAMAGMADFFGHLGGSGLTRIASQYMPGGVPLTPTIRGTLYDSSPPATDLPVGAEAAHICAVLQEHGLTPQSNWFVFLFLSRGIDAARNKYCGWHSIRTCDGVTSFQFATMPSQADLGCVIEKHPGYDLHCSPYSATTNALASVVSHEFMEGITDPHLNAWQDSRGGLGEIGDKCNFKFLKCTQMGSSSFQLQLEWSNDAGACVQP